MAESPAPSLFPNASDDQKALLEVVWQSFLDRQRWPLFQYVEDVLEDQGRDAARTLATFPRYQSVPYAPVWWPRLGTPDADSPVSATIAGLVHVDAAGTVLDAFVVLLRNAAERWRSLPLDPGSTRSLELGFGEFVQLFADEETNNADAVLVRALQTLIEHEPATWGGVIGRDDGEWRWRVPPTIKKFGHIVNVGEYLATLDSYVKGIQISQQPHLRPLTQTSIGGEGAEDVSTYDWIDRDLWADLGDLIEAKEWQRVARECAMFLEARLRVWGRLKSSMIGAELVTAALHPKTGTISLAPSLGQSAAEGWHLMALGFTRAVRNVVVHRVNDFDDEERAMGAVGTVSLILTQLRAHPDLIERDGDEV